MDGYLIASLDSACTLGSHELALWDCPCMRGDHATQCGDSLPSDFHRAITSNLFRNPSLAYELSCQWEYHTCIHTTIAWRLRLTSELKGFTGTLLPGSREGHDPNLNCSVPLPLWADVLRLVEVPGAVVVDASGREELDSGRMDSLDNDDGTLPHELDVNTDLVIQLMEHINTTASLDDISM